MLAFAIWRAYFRQMATLLRAFDDLSTEGLKRTREIEMGLPVKMVRVLLKDGDIGIADLARVIAPRRTLERRLKEGERLTAEESDRLARLLRTLDLADTIFDGRKDAVRWLSTPKDAFERRIPLDLLRTEVGGRTVEDRLLRLKHGFFA